jgi:hypothetical protein
MGVDVDGSGFGVDDGAAGDHALSDGGLEDGLREHADLSSSGYLPASRAKSAA